MLQLTDRIYNKLSNNYIGYILHNLYNYNRFFYVCVKYLQEDDVLKKERGKYLVLSIFIMLCGLWYSFYTEKEVFIVAPDETVYHYKTKTEEDFVKMIKAEKMVDINTAGIDEFKILKGIGDKTAQRIIDYRNENGNFKSIEEIKNVKGIGDFTFNNIKDFISVEGEN